MRKQQTAEEAETIRVRAREGGGERKTTKPVPPGFGALETMTSAFPTGPPPGTCFLNKGVDGRNDSTVGQPGGLSEGTPSKHLVQCLSQSCHSVNSGYFYFYHHRGRSHHLMAWPVRTESRMCCLPFLPSFGNAADAWSQSQRSLFLPFLHPSVVRESCPQKDSFKP